MARYSVKDLPANVALGLTPGEVLAPYSHYDYGMVRDHEALTGKTHINLSRDGQTPFFTVPLADVEAL